MLGRTEQVQPPRCVKVSVLADVTGQSRVLGQFRSDNVGRMRRKLRGLIQHIPRRAAAMQLLKNVESQRMQQRTITRQLQGVSRITQQPMAKQVSKLSKQRAPKRKPEVTQGSGVPRSNLARCWNQQWERCTQAQARPHPRKHRGRKK